MSCQNHWPCCFAPRGLGVATAIGRAFTNSLEEMNIVSSWPVASPRYEDGLGLGLGFSFFFTCAMRRDATRRNERRAREAGVVWPRPGAARWTRQREPYAAPDNTGKPRSAGIALAAGAVPPRVFAPPVAPSLRGRRESHLVAQVHALPLLKVEVAVRQQTNCLGRADVLKAHERHGRRAFAHHHLVVNVQLLSQHLRQLLRVCGAHLRADARI